MWFLQTSEAIGLSFSCLLSFDLHGYFVLEITNSDFLKMGRPRSRKRKGAEGAFNNLSLHEYLVLSSYLE